MNCPCGNDTLVVDSRPSPEGYVRRRRECQTCGMRFSTYEVEASDWRLLKEHAGKARALARSLKLVLEVHGACD